MLNGASVTVRPLILQAISAGDSVLVIALVHKTATAWLTSVQVLHNAEIMNADLNDVLSKLQNEIAQELNSQDLPPAEVVTP
jgi:hypothetical protein